MQYVQVGLVRPLFVWWRVCALRALDGFGTPFCAADIFARVSALAFFPISSS
jgi:hypothetical protein